MFYVVSLFLHVLMAGKEDKLSTLSKLYREELGETELNVSDVSTESVSKSEQLIDSYIEDLNRLTLRSGLDYPTNPVVVKRNLETSKPVNQLPVTTMTATTPSTTTIPTSTISQPNTTMSAQVPPNTGSVFPSTFKVLPTEASIRPFAGGEEDYSAFQFMTICEDVMRNSDISRPADQISFVRSRIQPGSQAMSLMQGMALSTREIGQDFDKFKQNFLKVFSDGAASTLVKQANLLVDSVTKDLGAMDIWKATIPGETYSVEFIRVLRDAGWTTGNHMNLDNLQKFLGLVVYLLHVQGRARRVAESLPFNPADDMIDYIKTVQSKMKENAHSATMTAAVAGVIQPSTSNVDVNPTAHTGAVGKQRVVCSYCNKIGHVEKKCLRRRADLRKGTSSAHENVMEGNLSVRPKPHSPSRGGGNLPKSSPAKTAGQWTCIIHGIGNHSSERCFTIRKIKEEHEQNRRSTERVKTSGEGARAVSNKPD